MNIFSKAFGFSVLVALPLGVASQTGEDSSVMPAGQQVSALTNDVSSNGSFSYAVPFDLPAFRGLVPGVSLSIIRPTRLLAMSGTCLELAGA